MHYSGYCSHLALSFTYWLSQKDIFTFNKTIVAQPHGFTHISHSALHFLDFLFTLLAEEKVGLCGHLFTPRMPNSFFCQRSSWPTPALLLFTAWFFYLITRLPFGAYSIHEILIIAARFYCCFIVFCIPGLLLTLLPLNFQTANTVFSIASFFMLALGIAQSAFPENTRALFNTLNLLSLGKAIMADGIQTYRITIISAFIIFVITMKSVCKHLRINPVWSRY